MSRVAPSLRFSEFSEPWKPGHASDAFRSRRERGENGLPIYSVTLDRGLVRRDSLDRYLAADAADEQNLRAKPGDVVYNTMRMWQGAVGIAPEDCMVSPAYVVLAPKKGAFFEQWFKNPHMRHLLGSFSHGITDDRLRLYPNDFAQIPLHLPSLEEQERIASALATVDRKIALLCEKRDALERFKAGTMDRIFRQEVRFRRDDGSEFPGWVETKLRDLTIFSKGRGISKADIDSTGPTPCIRYGEIYTQYNERITDVVSRTSAPVDGLLLSRRNDIIIPASGETSIDMARACCVLLEGVALGGDINVLRTNGMNGEFLAYFLTHGCKREIARLAQGNSVVHLYAEQLRSVPVVVPHMDEQVKIAAALAALDGKIDAVAAQIAQMEAFRKGLIQGLFP